MKRAAKQIAVGAVILLVFCIICRLCFFRSYTVSYPLNAVNLEIAGKGSLQFSLEEPGIFRTGTPEIRGNSLLIPIIPEKAGATYLDITGKDGEDIGIVAIRVTRFLTVFDSNTGGFSGDTAVMLASTVFWLLTAAVMAWNFFQLKGASFYQYYSIWFAGFSLFAGITALCLLEVSLRHFLNPVSNTMLYVYSALSGASVQFIFLTAPLYILFALAMGISNIVLLRHVRPRPQNILGIGVSILLVLCIGLAVFISTRDFSGSEWESRVHSTLTNTFATAVVYFECMLAGSVLCGIRSTRGKPAPDKDFIIILGCWFRKDGTLPPLLCGRADRALDFWRKQKEASGKEAFFIPSGGQGPDEPMPEGEAIRRYLLEQGVPNRLILPETVSRNTYENMSFSRNIIRKNIPDGKAVFATTNYHIFRSGIWASTAGLKAEGIGSRSRWWFWPNAFMRETAGLLAKRWKQEILLLLFLIVYFAALSLLIG